MAWAELSAPEVTYVDQNLTKPIVGREAYTRLLEQLKGWEYDHMNPFRRLYSEISGREGLADAALWLTDPEMESYFRAFVESAVFPTAGSAEAVIARLSGMEDILVAHDHGPLDGMLQLPDIARPGVSL